MIFSSKRSFHEAIHVPTAGSVCQYVYLTRTPEVQTDHADTGSMIESLEAAAMPLGTNRNFQALINLVPCTT
jgi:hypothetical protein